MLTKTNPLSQTIRYAYDARDRLLTKTYPDTSTVRFTYTPTGQRATAVDARGTTTYAYDGRNRLTTLTYPDGQAIGYTYDAASGLTSISSLAGTIGYVYDHSGRLHEVIDPAGRTSIYSYDAAGRRTGLAYPNGTSVTSAHDANGRLLELTHRDTIGQVLAAYTYTLNPSGQRTRIEESTGGTRAQGRRTTHSSSRGNSGTRFRTSTTCVLVTTRRPPAGSSPGTWPRGMPRSPTPSTLTSMRSLTLSTRVTRAVCLR